MHESGGSGSGSGTFDAVRIKEDMSQKFGGDPEDTNMDMHPLSCMHAPGRKKVVDYPETWSTRMAGGLDIISREIEKIALSTDDIDTLLNVDQANMDLTQHSTVLFCEICMKHSVVSYESYQRTTRDMVDYEGNWKVLEDIGFKYKGETGVFHNSPFKSGGEYYLHIALTAKTILKTPLFSRNNNPETLETVAIPALVIPALVIPALVIPLSCEEKHEKKRKNMSKDSSKRHKKKKVYYTPKDAEVEVWNPSTTNIQETKPPPSLPSQPQKKGVYRPWDGVCRVAIRVQKPPSSGPSPQTPQTPSPTTNLPVMYGVASSPSITQKDVFRGMFSGPRRF